MTGCGVFFFLIFLIIAIIATALFSPNNKRATYVSVGFLVAIVVFPISIYSCNARNEREAKEKQIADKKEIEDIKQKIETDGYIGLSESQIEKVYGRPLSETKMSTASDGYGIWSLGYSFGDLTIKNGTVIGAPRHGSKHKDDSTPTKSLKLSRGTIRVNMTSDEFVRIVDQSNVESQISNPSILIPGSLEVNKFCNVNGQKFQVRLARISFNGPYRVTQIWILNQTKPAQ